MTSAIRRVTITAVDMAESIRFYTEVLDLRVFYDQVLTTPPGTESLLGPEGNSPHRLVSLQQGDSTTGMIGLIDYMQPDLGIKTISRPPGEPYPLVVIFAVEDIMAVAAKGRDAGYRIIAEPHEWYIPGKGMGAGMSFLDPSGVLVEMTQLPSRDPEQKDPISPVRRVTIPVNSGKMAESIRFYQQAMGMTVYYDDIIVSGEGQSSLGMPGTVKSRLVSMQQGDHRFGMVGLLEYLEPAFDIQPIRKMSGYPWGFIFVFVTEDMDYIIEQTPLLGGSVVARKTYDIPNRGKVDGAIITDPNGVPIDMTRWLS